MRRYEPGKGPPQQTEVLYLLLGYVDDLATVENHLGMSPYTLPVPLASGTADKAREQAQGCLHSAYFSAFSTSLVELEWLYAIDVWQGNAPLLATVHYRPGAAEAAVKAFNTQRNTHLPADLPVDVVGLLGSFPMVATAADLRAELDNIDEDTRLGDLLIPLLCLGIFEYENRESALKPYIGRSEPLLRLALAHASGILNADGLGDRLLASETDPERREQLRTVLEQRA
jgi:hypothetical protein